MTTIVAIQGSNFAIVGTDSRVSSVDGNGFPYQTSTAATGFAKVASNGNYLLGAAGDIRAINILHHAFNPPAAQAAVKGKRLDKFMTTKFIPALRQTLEVEGYATQASTLTSQTAECNSTVLVVVNGVIYVIDSDYGWVSDQAGFYAIGSGASFALGSMHTSVGRRNLNKLQARQIALKALAAAAKYDPFTGAPFSTFMQESE
jgi:ATP-dependent protease HslVU (ClpYQ) peptidase subunit